MSTETGTPQATTTTDAAIYLADLVLIPFQPSAFDVWRLEVTLDGVAAAQEDNGGKPEARLILNQTSDRDSFADTVRELLGKHDIPHCNTNIPRLNVFRDAPDQATAITRSPYKRDQLHKKRFLKLLHELVGPLIEKQPRRIERAANE